MSEEINVTRIIEEVCNTICDKLCKYSGTGDDDCICDYIKEHDECPLDRLH